MSADELVRLMLCVSAVAVLAHYHRQIREAIESFRNNLPRGGPPSPMHPSPGIDDERLRALRGSTRAATADY